MATILKMGQPNRFSAKKTKGIENHKKIMVQMLETAELPLAEANHPEYEYHERAFQGAVNAFGFLSLVREAHRKI